ncbi:MAG TPA: DUF819 family protein [Thermomonas sp.]|nr:DUF819 family protein [Thermomonas sp.]HRA56771.1 DUF819 family protein [Thermomonas sp.]
MPQAFIQDDIVIFGLIAGTLGLVFWTASRPGRWQKFYNVVPPLLLCYLLPGIYNSLGLIDGAHSKLYNPVASRVLLPAALVLLTMAVDLRAILRLGPKLLAMYAATSASIVLGAALAFISMRAIAPETMAGDTWAGMATLAGSWIGGGANMMAMKEIFAVDATTFGRFAVVDVGVGYAWMAVLLMLAQRAANIDARSGANTAALDDLKQRVEAYRSQHERIPTLTDLMIIVGISFGTVGLAHALATPLSAWFGAHVSWAAQVSLDAPFVWIVGLCTLVGLGLSFTRARALEGAGASTIGTLLLYYLIASIGMQMEIGALFEKPLLLVLGVVWLGFHIVILWLVGRWLNVPLFYFAIGSQSHIGGPASAPVVASAFHPALAPVGALLGTLGYATGTVLAYLTGLMLRAIAGG